MSILPRYAFDFALSFAGEDRSKAKRIAKLLLRGGAVVFYDDKFKSELHGKSLTDEFQRIYGRTSRYVVVLVSEYYPRKDYTNYEFGVAKKAGKKRKAEYILPLRIDDTQLLGLPADVAYFDLRKTTLKETAKLLLKKLKKKVRAQKQPSKHRKAKKMKPKRIKPRIIKLAATFGVNVSEMDTSIIPRRVPRVYYAISDWLIKKLRARLWGAGLNFDFLGDERDGETLSARVAFDWDPNSKELDFGDTSPWELLELLPYSELYPDE